MSKVDDDIELIRNELNRVLYDYRIIENDRKAFNHEAKFSLQKQEKELKRLNEENRKLMIIYNLINDPAYQVKDILMKSELNTLLNAQKEVNEMINTEIDKKIDFKKALDDSQKEIYLLEKLLNEMLGVNENRKIKYSKIDNSFLNLKNMSGKCNRKIKENGLLREEINHLKSEKKKNDVTLSELKTSLKVADDELKYLSDESKLAYEQRREGYAKISALKERNDREERKFLGELRELFRITDHHRKLADFMLKKVDSRISIKNKIQADISTPKVRHKAFNLKEYEKFFSKFSPKLMSTNLKESKELFKNIIIELESKEKENYSLFSYMYSLQLNVNELQRLIEKYKKHLRDADGKHDADTTIRQMNFDRVEAEYISLKNKIEKFQEISTIDDHLIKTIHETLKLTFTELECQNEEAYKKRLDTFDAVNLENIVLFLKSIEQRVNQLITAFYFKKFKEDPHLTLRGSHNIVYHRKRIRENILLSSKQIEFDDAIDIIESKSVIKQITTEKKHDKNYLLPIDSRETFNVINSNFYD